MVADNQILDNYPIYIQIKRNFTDRYASIIFKIHKKLISSIFEIYAMNELLDIKHKKEIENDYYQFEIYNTITGKKLLFDKLDRLSSFSGQYKRVHKTIFAFDLKNMDIQTTITNSSNKNIISFEYKYIYELNYKITGSSLFDQNFTSDKNSSKKCIKLIGNITYPKNNEKLTHILKLKYINLFEDKQILPMNKKLFNLFYLNESKIILENNFIKNIIPFSLFINNKQYEWIVDYYVNFKNKYNKLNKQFELCNDNENSENGYRFPLWYDGNFSYNLNLQNWFLADKQTIFKYENAIKQKIFDQVNGKIRLSIDKYNFANKDIEKIINGWKYKKFK